MGTRRVDEKIPVTFFCHSLADGGAEKVVSNLLNGLDRHRFEISLVLVASQIDFYVPADVKIHILDQSVRGIILRQRELASLWSRYPPGIVIAHGTTVSIDAVFARRICQVYFPVICVEHSVFSEVTQLQHPGGNFRSYRRIVEYSYSKAEAVVAVSMVCANDLFNSLGLCADRVNIIRNPVVTPSLMESVTGPYDNSWFDGSSHSVIVGIGRLIPEKRYTDLVKAFSIVAHKRKNARLVIFGRGPERDSLLRLARSLEVDGKVSLPGFCDNPYPAMSRASVFVHPSITEAMPNVLIEAIALGVPVVASRISGNAELLSQTVENLVPPGDISGFATAISRALDSPSSCRVATGAVAEFDEAVAIAAYEKLLKRVHLQSRLGSPHVHAARPGAQ